ncbi:MAG: hypothetical protein KDB18_11405 [Salinibacterium sp.]|nr:hypothetical protein [Salinibacterium sp.]
MKTRLFLTFDKPSLDSPILSTLTSQFGLVFNIYGATVNEEVQFVALEIEGDEGAIRAAISYLQQRGVQVERRDS